MPQPWGRFFFTQMWEFLVVLCKKTTLREKKMLYRLTNRQNGTVVHLLGSNHLVKQQSYVPTVHALIERCTHLITETANPPHMSIFLKPIDENNLPAPLEERLSERCLQKIPEDIREDARYSSLVQILFCISLMNATCEKNSVEKIANVINIEQYALDAFSGAEGKRVTGMTGESEHASYFSNVIQHMQKMIGGELPAFMFEHFLDDMSGLMSGVAKAGEEMETDGSTASQTAVQEMGLLGERDEMFVKCISEILNTSVSNNDQHLAVVGYRHLDLMIPMFEQMGHVDVVLVLQEVYQGN